MYWATCPVEATTGAASNAAIVEAIGDDVIMAGSGVVMPLMGSRL